MSAMRNSTGNSLTSPLNRNLTKEMPRGNPLKCCIPSCHLNLVFTFPNAYFYTFNTPKEIF